jgi:hypothetical protein
MKYPSDQPPRALNSAYLIAASDETLKGLDLGKSSWKEARGDEEEGGSGEPALVFGTKQWRFKCVRTGWGSWEGVLISKLLQDFQDLKVKASSVLIGYETHSPQAWTI